MKSIITKSSCEDCKPVKIRIYAIAVGAALVLVAGATSSCGTAGGFGQDVKETGDIIQEAAAQ